MKDYRQRQVYVIRWRPSQCSVDPIEEIILDTDDSKHVIGKVLIIIIIEMINNNKATPIRFIFSHYPPACCCILH